MNHKLYFLSVFDLSVLVTSVMLDGYLRNAGLLIGILVGILTVLKLIQDIKLRKIERKLKLKELEDKWPKK